MKNIALLTTLLISLLNVQIALADVPKQEADGEAYIIQADDWLSKLSDKFYGDILAYPLIVEAANTKAGVDDSFTYIENPDVIEIGQKIWIPTHTEARLTIDQLKNLIYQGIYNDPETIQLSDGIYEGEPFEPGAASRPTVRFVEEVIGFGDLNTDGLEDAVVILIENSGGSGSFRYLAVVINSIEGPSNTATEFIGDRVQINEIIVTENNIELEVKTHDPSDGLCCPSVEATLIYRLENDKLIVNETN